jgi:hypothetical protein
MFWAPFVDYDNNSHLVFLVPASGSNAGSFLCLRLRLARERRRSQRTVVVAESGARREEKRCVPGRDNVVLVEYYDAAVGGAGETPSRDAAERATDAVERTVVRELERVEAAWCGGRGAASAVPDGGRAKKTGEESGGAQRVVTVAFVGHALGGVAVANLLHRGLEGRAVVAGAGFGDFLRPRPGAGGRAADAANGTTGGQNAGERVDEAGRAAPARDGRAPPPPPILCRVSAAAIVGAPLADGAASGVSGGVSSGRMQRRAARLVNDFPEGVGPDARGFEKQDPRMTLEAQ